MGRDWKRKTVTHGQTSAEDMERAVNEVIIGKSARTVARDLNIKRSTLQRYVKKQKQLFRPSQMELMLQYP